MAINLGDVNFGVGADLTNLRRSVSGLQAFSRQVDAAQGAVDGLGNALRRQEKAAGDAFIKTQNLASSMNRIKGSEQYVSRVTQAYTQFNNTMTSGRLSTLEMQRAQERLRVSLANTQNEFRNFTNESRRASAGAGGLVDSLRNMQASAVLMTGPMGGLATRISAFTAITKTAGFSMAAFAAGAVTMIGALVKIGTEANRVGAMFKGWESGLKAVTGSQEEANKEIKFAVNVAEEAGTQLQGTAAAWTKFAAAAEGTALQGAKSRDVFETFAKAATTLNLSMDDTAGIFKALEQMISKGTVQAEELRGQLGDRLPGAFQLAARAMGVSTSKLGEMMKKGEVMSNDMLPKLAAELKKTFNIPDGPLQTYAASMGRLQTAYERLMIAIDQKFNITGKVAAAADAISNALTWVRTNLDDVVAGTALAAAGILAMLNPLIGIPATIAALDQFGDKFRVIAGEAGTLADYMHLVWGDIKTSVMSGTSDITNSLVTAFTDAKPYILDAAAFIGEASKVGILGGLDAAQAGIDAFLNGLINGMKSAWQGLVAMWPALPAAIADGVISAMNSMIQAVNTGLQAVANGINSIISGISSVKTAMGGEAIEFKVDIAIPEVENKFKGAGAKAGAAFDEAWSNSSKNQVDYMGAINKGLKEVNGQTVDYVKNLRERANQEAAIRNINQSGEQARKDALQHEKDMNAEKDRQKRLNDTLARFGNDEGGGSGKKNKKAAREAERRVKAINDIEEAIKRADEEIAALSDGEGAVKRLNEEFKRRDEVEKYGNALRKAGVDADYIKTKTDELYNKLKERDALKLSQQGMQEWSDAVSQSVDFFSESLVDLAFDGKDAFENIAKAAQNLAKDLINTFLQLSLTNPLKNLLFGQSNPTLAGGGGGGFLSSIFSGIGSIFGGGTGFGKNYFPPAPKLRKGGVSPVGFGNYQRAANGMITKPTFLNTPMGTVQGGEAGTEAIMPLEKDSSGSLGIRATVPNGGGNVTVNVYAPEGNKVKKQQSTDSNGDSIIDIFIEQAKQAIAGDIASGGTAMNKAMEGRYGLAASAGLSK